jgi:hypothetical protein
MSVSADVAPVLTNSLFSSCFLGILYLFLSVLFSFIGGVVGRKER